MGVLRILSNTVRIEKPLHILVITADYCELVIPAMGGCIRKKPMYINAIVFAFLIEHPKKIVHASHPLGQESVIANDGYGYHKLAHAFSFSAMRLLVPTSGFPT